MYPSRPIAARPVAIWAKDGPSSPRQRRVLFLDDEPWRAASFLTTHPEAIWVQTVEDCVARLSESWSEVHLDHDLGGQRYVDPSSVDCGMEVVRWICRERPHHLRQTRFFIHSRNQKASILMVDTLIRSGFAAELRPFGDDLVDFIMFDELPCEATGPRKSILNRCFQHLALEIRLFLWQLSARAREEYFRE